MRRESEDEVAINDVKDSNDAVVCFLELILAGKDVDV